MRVATTLVMFTLMVTTPDVHAFWGWMRGTVVTQFETSDWDLLKATAQSTLNDAADGTQVNWRNEQTGNAGAVKVLLSFEHDARPCRRMAFLNVSSDGARGVANYSLCRQANDTWAYVSDSELAQ